MGADLKLAGSAGRQHEVLDIALETPRPSEEKDLGCTR